MIQRVKRYGLIDPFLDFPFVDSKIATFYEIGWKWTIFVGTSGANWWFNPYAGGG